MSHQEAPFLGPVAHAEDGDMRKMITAHIGKQLMRLLAGARGLLTLHHFLYKYSHFVAYMDGAFP